MMLAGAPRAPAAATTGVAKPARTESLATPKCASGAGRVTKSNYSLSVARRYLSMRR